MRKELYLISVILVLILIIGYSCDSPSEVENNVGSKVYYAGGPNSDSWGAYYKTVKIGDQVWFKENLNVGVMIRRKNNIGIQIDNGIIEKFCYNNEEDSGKIYGGVYQWDEAMQYDSIEGAQGICPDGWHIPTYAEIEELRSVVDSNGNALKVEGLGSPYYDAVGTNTSGFSALLAGWSTFTSNSGPGHFNYINKISFFWSSKKEHSNAYNMSVYYEYNSVTLFPHHTSHGMSVRCIKD